MLSNESSGSGSVSNAAVAIEPIIFSRIIGKAEACMVKTMVQTCQHINDKMVIVRLSDQLGLSAKTPRQEQQLQSLEENGFGSDKESISEVGEKTVT